MWHRSTTRSPALSSDAPFRLDAAIIGAQKAATSTLFERLAAHPGVSGCTPKEPQHFSHEGWEARMGDYRAMFPRFEGRLTLEASTSYSFGHRSDIVAGRLHAHNPDMRIIYVVRDPVARILSAYRHSVSRGYRIAPSIEQAVAKPTSRLVENTRYATRLAPYRDLFGPERVLVLTFDDVTMRQRECVARAQAFLGLPHVAGAQAAANLSSVPKLHHRHDGNLVMETFARVAPRTYARLAKPAADADDTLRPETAAALRRELAPEIETIERWTGRDLSSWRS